MMANAKPQTGITLCWSWEAVDTKGAVCAVSDVLAATTNIARMLTQGTKKLVLVNDETVEPVLARLKNAIPVGESRKLPRGFFSVSNHPQELFRYDFRNRQVIYMSNNGTRVIADVLKKGARSVTAVSFVNMSAVLAYLQTQRDRRLILVAAGEGTYEDPHAPEDYACITELSRILAGGEPLRERVFTDLEKRMRAYYGRNFWEEDVGFVLKKDTCPVVPVFVSHENGTIDTITV